MAIKLPSIIFRSNRGVQIATTLWTELTLEPDGSFWDRYGIDGYLNGGTIQIKYDRRIAISGNIYHEMYEKSANNVSQPWRKSPGIAVAYIFTTETSDTIFGYLITVDELATKEIRRILTLINPNNACPTSIGILIPLISLNKETRTRLKDKL